MACRQVKNVDLSGPGPEDHSGATVGGIDMGIFQVYYVFLDGCYCACIQEMLNNVEFHEQIAETINLGTAIVSGPNKVCRCILTLS